MRTRGRCEARERRSCSCSGWPPEQENDVDAKPEHLSSNVTHTFTRSSRRRRTVVLVRSADHVQHVKQRAQDDMGEQFATKQFMERHDSVTQGVIDKQDRSSADKHFRRLSVG